MLQFCTAYTRNRPSGLVLEAAVGEDEESECAAMVRDRLQGVGTSSLFACGQGGGV